MATFADLKILQDWALTSFRYSDTTFRQLLNEQTGGTIVSQAMQTPGSYYQEVYWANDSNQAVLDNPNDQQAATNESLKQVSQFDIKVAARMKPYEWQSIGHRWQGTTPEQQAIIWGRTVAESFMRLKIESICGALVACFNQGINTAGTAVGGTGADAEVAKVIENQSGTAASPDNRVDMSKLMLARGKMGDMAGDIRGIIMHSGAYYGMHAENLKQFKEVFTYDTAFVMRSPEGLMFYVTDLPILTFTDNNVVKYRTLLLRPRAAVLRDQSDYNQLIDNPSGQKWIQTVAQAEQTFSLFIKGFSWKTRATIHPGFGTTSDVKLKIGTKTNAGAIDTPASWERVGTAESKPITFKELPGVMLLSQ